LVVALRGRQKKCNPSNRVRDSVVLEKGKGRAKLKFGRRRRKSNLISHREGRRKIPAGYIPGWKGISYFCSFGGGGGGRKPRLEGGRKLLLLLERREGKGGCGRPYHDSKRPPAAYQEKDVLSTFWGEGNCITRERKDILLFGTYLFSEEGEEPDISSKRKEGGGLFSALSNRQEGKEKGKGEGGGVYSTKCKGKGFLVGRNNIIMGRKNTSFYRNRVG